MVSKEEDVWNTPKSKCHHVFSLKMRLIWIERQQSFFLKNLLVYRLTTSSASYGVLLQFQAKLERFTRPAATPIAVWISSTYTYLLLQRVRVSVGDLAVNVNGLKFKFFRGSLLEIKWWYPAHFSLINSIYWRGLGLRLKAIFHSGFEIMSWWIQWSCGLNSMAAEDLVQLTSTNGFVESQFHISR